MSSVGSSDQRKQFLADYRNRMIEVSGLTEGRVREISECLSVEDVEDHLRNGVTGSQAADTEMSYWNWLD